MPEDTCQKIFNAIKMEFITFEENHIKGESGNKAARKRARQAIGNLKKFVTEYRKLSVAEGK